MKVEADNGCAGWGETGPSAWSRERIVESAVHHFQSFLLGRDPRHLGAIWKNMYRGGAMEGGRMVAAATSAVDITLHDLVTRSLNIPVHQLLGGKQRDFIPCFTPVGDDAAVPRWVEQGWECLRLSMSTSNDEGIYEPRESIALAAPRMIRVRESVGAGPVLGVDYRHAFSVAEAGSFCQRLPAGTLDFIEDPIREATPGAYAALRQITDIPFAVGEVFTSKWQWRPYLEQDLVNLARIDIANVGGFTESMKIVGWCETHFVDMMPHLAITPIATATIIHFMAAVSTVAWMEDRNRNPDGSFRPKNPEIYIKQPTPEGARYPVTEEPGLGIEIDERALRDLIAAEPFQFDADHGQYHRDGSRSY